MAFLIPLIEGIEFVGSALAAAEATEVAAASAVAADAVATSEAVAMDVVQDEAGAAAYEMDLNEVEPEYEAHDLDRYENDYMRLPLEDPDLLEGMPIEGVTPFNPAYVGAAGEAGYMLLPQEEAAAFSAENALSYLGDDPLTRTVITVGAGKAILAAGFWYILDPLTGGPVYAIAGDDPRVHSIMESLGYTSNAEEAGHVIREWFQKLFGYGMTTESPAGPYTTAVSEGAPSRPSRVRTNLILRDQGSRKNFPKMAYRTTTGRKRQRSNSVVATPRVMAIPAAPSMLRVMPKRRGTKRIYTQTRQLVRFLSMQIAYDGTDVSYGVSGQVNMSTSGGNIDNLGFHWSGGSFGYVVRLTDFNEFLDIKNSFDQYRIKSCSFTFIPARDEGIVNSSFQLPVLVAAEDKDDVSLTGLTTEKLSSKQGMKYFRLEDPFTLRIKPTPWTNESTTQPKSKILGGWLPTVNDSVKHYGLKVRPILNSLSVTANGANYLFTLMVKISVEGKLQD